MEIRAGHTGEVFRTEAHVDRIPDYDPRTGDHLWTMITIYRINPANLNGNGPGLLDRENLLSIQGPGCYYCELPYSELLDKRRCRGHGID